MRKYKITDIKSVQTGETRTDGRYPIRIGSIVSIYHLAKDNAMILTYHKDNQGNSKEGSLWTSIVQNIEKDNSGMIVHTLNSIYYLEEESKHS